MIDLLQRVWRVPLPQDAGYGRFNRDGETQFRTFSEFVLAVANPGIYNWAILREKDFDCDIVYRAIAEIEKNASLLDVACPSLLHGDLGSYNLLGDGSRITGLIDWELALYGDPMYDAANLFFWNEDKLQPLLSRLRDRFAKDEAGRRKLYAYMLRIGLEEIYNVVGLNGIGYDNEWVVNRVLDILRRQTAV